MIRGMAREAKQAGVGFGAKPPGNSVMPARKTASGMSATMWRSLSTVAVALVGVLGVGCDAEPETTEAPELAVGEGSSRLDLAQGSAEQGSSEEEPGGNGVEVPVDQVAEDGPGDIDPLIEPDPIPWHLPAPETHANDA